MPDQLNKSFVFTNKAEEIYPLTLTVNNYLVATRDIDDAVQFRLKVIITELLTNALKHSGGADSVVEITTSANKIIISKTDNGYPFTLNTGDDILTWPIHPDNNTGQTINLYNDAESLLKCRVNDDGGLRFFVEEKDYTADGQSFKEHLSEHYGLMIITKAGDVFDYEYDVINRCNKFIITIFLTYL